MSSELSPQKPRSFRESWRMLHRFLLEQKGNGVVDMEEVENFAQREGLTFGCCLDDGSPRSYLAHLDFLERHGAIDIVEEEDKKYIYFLDNQDLL